MSDVIVVDDFYKDPSKVRDYALNVEWIREANLAERFPGKESRRSFFTEAVVDRFAELVGRSIVVNPGRTTFGAFALTSEDDQRNWLVHVDPCMWTAIIYLTPNHLASGGTCMMRHKRTGVTHVPRGEELERMNFGSEQEFYRDVIVPSSTNPDDWEIDVSVGMQFNRLLLFKGGKRFHAPMHYFGTAGSDARLTQLFFFDTVEVDQ